MNKNSGFTLIEVLISAVLLAGGLLGLAATQAASLKHNQSAYNRSLATQLAYDMADRMRANIAGIAKYTAIYTPPAPRAIANCLTTTGCTPAQMAENDLNEWHSAMGVLPLGQGTISINAGVYTINIIWDDDGSGDIITNPDPGQTPDPSFQTSFKI